MPDDIAEGKLVDMGLLVGAMTEAKDVGSALGTLLADTEEGLG